MKIVVGLDIGGSTTKIVGMRGKEIVASEIVRAGDPVTSAFGAVGKLINDNGLKTDDISRINITGVGASYTTTPVFGIETVVVEEFISTGLGGLYLSGLDHAVANLEQLCRGQARKRKQRQNRQIRKSADKKRHSKQKVLSKNIRQHFFSAEVTSFLTLDFYHS